MALAVPVMSYTLIDNSGVYIPEIKKEITLSMHLRPQKSIKFQV